MKQQFPILKRGRVGDWLEGFGKKQAVVRTFHIQRDVPGIVISKSGRVYQFQTQNDMESFLQNEEDAVCKALCEGGSFYRESYWKILQHPW